MKSSREAVAAALFALLEDVTWTDPYTDAPGQEFEYTTRRPTLPENVDAARQPYLGLEMLDEDDTQATAMGLTEYRIEFRCYVYARADADPDVAGESLLNVIMDAIDAALQNQNQPGERQTLGGLVTNCWIEGRVTRSNGLLDQQMYLIVPIVTASGI